MDVFFFIVIIVISIFIFKVLNKTFNFYYFGLKGIVGFFLTIMLFTGMGLTYGLALIGYDFYSNSWEGSDKETTLKSVKSIKDNEFKSDTITYYDGSVYVGEIVSGEPNGIGKITYPDGSYYEGEFENGDLEGDGIIYSIDGSKLEGQFSQGLINGIGLLTFSTF